MENLKTKSNFKKWITSLSSVLILALIFTIFNSTSIGDYFKASLPGGVLPNTPTCTITATPDAGNSPLIINKFTVTTTGSPTNYGIRFDEDGEVYTGEGDLGTINGGVYTAPGGVYTYTELGTHIVTLVVWTDESNPGVCTETIRVSTVDPVPEEACSISLSPYSQYSGEAPLDVTFDLRHQYMHEYVIESWEIYVNTSDSLPTYSYQRDLLETQNHTYTNPGTYVARLVVNYDEQTDICESDPITVLPANTENDQVTFENTVYLGTKEDYLHVEELEEVDPNDELPAPATVVLESRISDLERDDVSLTQFAIMVNEWIEDGNDIEDICDTSQPITETCYLMALSEETFDNPIPKQTPYTFYEEVTLGQANSQYYVTVFTRETIDENAPNDEDKYRWASTHNRDEALEINTGAGGNTSPTCSITVSPDQGYVPHTVTDFDIQTNAGDPDDEIIGFTLNMGDNSTIYEGEGDPEDRPQGSYTYDHSATFIVTLDIENSDGQHGECKDTVSVNEGSGPDNAIVNIDPKVLLQNGNEYNGSQRLSTPATLTFEATMTDEENNEVDLTQFVVGVGDWIDDPNELPDSAICPVDSDNNIIINNTCYFFADTDESFTDPNPHGTPYTYSRTVTLNQELTDYYFTVYTRETIGGEYRWTDTHTQAEVKTIITGEEELVEYYDKPVIIRSSLYQPEPVDFDGFYDGDEQRPSRTPIIKEGSVLGFRAVLNDTDTGENPADPVNNVKYVISNRTGNVPPPCDVVDGTVIVDGNCYYTEGSELADTPVSFINYLKFNQEGVYYFDIYADEHVTLENGNEYDVRERTNTDTEESVRVTVLAEEIPPVVQYGDVTLELTIPLQDRDNNPNTDRGTNTATVWLKLESQVIEIAPRVTSFQTDAEGRASVSFQNVPLGANTITVKTDQHLAKARAVKLVTGSNTVSFDYLLGGDIAGNAHPVAQGTFDDLVNSVDIGDLYLYWGTKLGEADYSRIADLDANTEVGAEDFSTLISNAGKNGEW
ncbi:MAG: hypothetical protein PHU71_02080 [Candidatus Gracilibacteria bacterium]|nr:hypothetical protein [Candidatus Gracilibacteria bacterium]